MSEEVFKSNLKNLTQLIQQDLNDVGINEIFQKLYHKPLDSDDLRQVALKFYSINNLLGTKDLINVKIKE
jgi:hypothetical protein|tara:strand:- start:4482 stop:4691 length:210 start_codon:yes stop_codon:yes gene_type:complete